VRPSRCGPGNTRPAGSHRIRPTKSGVVLVIHDIRGLSDITRAVGDQLAQDGFIAIVPDFLSGKGPNGGGTESLGTGVGQAIQSLTPADVTARLNAAMEYGKKLPASNGKTGVIGFCWGGARSFGYAAAQPNLNGAVVYYGDAPGAGDGTIETQLANVKAPVLGLYAGNDARIGATVPPTEAAMKKLGKSYEAHTYEGAGHGFMGNQAGAAGANADGRIAPMKAHTGPLPALPPVPFTPAAIPSLSSADTRELGVRLFNIHLAAR